LATDRAEDAKACALAAYLDPGPKHLNCAQAVVHNGLLMMDGDPGLTSVAGYLGGGMVRMGQTCGALSGAAVTLGLRDHLDAQAQANDPNATFVVLQRLFQGFESEFGAVSCKELLGHDISSPEGFREAKRCHALNRCPEYVAWACDRLNEVLDVSGTAIKSDRVSAQED
jgi:C_GCAxxG_C_C family probable redox protein